MADWEIKRTLGQCHVTGEEFKVGEEYFAALVDTEEGFERRDYSVGCWQEQKPETYCYWKTKMPDSEKKRNLFVDDDMLMTFFERLGSETRQEKLDFRFVLALILMRKRILKYDSSKTDNGSEVWTLRVTGEKRMVDVVNPHLDEERIEQLSTQIGQVLQMDT
ncbi:MAG: hypothetical protein KAT00_04525 [Planctomycetes bacterium]|nr:hypothetical protein [Planctomycetota bacterium]